MEGHGTAEHFHYTSLSCYKTIQIRNFLSSQKYSALILLIDSDLPYFAEHYSKIFWHQLNSVIEGARGKMAYLEGTVARE